MKEIDGARVEKILDLASITLNKNSVPGERIYIYPPSYLYQSFLNFIPYRLSM